MNTFACALGTHPTRKCGISDPIQNQRQEAPTSLNEEIPDPDPKKASFNAVVYPQKKKPDQKRLENLASQKSYLVLRLHIHHQRLE
jgi:hypothetical protein